VHYTISRIRVVARPQDLCLVQMTSQLIVQTTHQDIPMLPAYSPEDPGLTLVQLVMGNAHLPVYTRV
jgi:hypothetical protein